MNINSISPSERLEQARAKQQEALKAKEAAEKAKAEAKQKDVDAAAALKKESAEADTAEQRIVTLEGEITNIQTRFDSANMRVQTANSAYLNAQSQLQRAGESKDESAVERAKDAVNRAFQELQNSQNEANNIKRELDSKIQEKKEAEEIAKKEREEAIQAQTAAEEAHAALTKTESDLAKAVSELEVADGELAEAEKLAEADATNGVEEAEHLSQEEIDKLVSEEGYVNITSKEQFLEIFQNGQIDLNGKYILSCDVDLSDVENWIPVGDSDNPFSGVFNGNGYSINNLTINVQEPDVKNVGFFGVTENAVISDVNFNNANVITPDDFIDGSSAVGIVAGEARGTKFENINVSGAVSGYESVGGLAGVINDNSYFKDGNFVEVSNSYISNVNTTVDASGKYYVGGLAGYIEGTETIEGVATKDLKISNCSTSGDIVFSEESGGGFIGEAGKTVITIANCVSSTNLTWDNEENDGDLSFLMESGRAGGFIGCVNGSYIAICNSEYEGNLNADGDFKGEYYGWYMYDAHVTVYDLPAGLPVDDILNVEGIDALTPIVDAATGIAHYEVTVSTLTGLDKMVSMIKANPALADMVTFNVNFDFESMDGMYDPSVYEQYGVVQKIYEDEEGNVHNDVYIDNEMDLETTFHPTYNCDNYVEIPIPTLKPTMVSGLYKNPDGNYIVCTNEGEKTVDLKFNYDSQIASVTKRLDSDEVRYREYITQMVQYYQNKMYESIKALFGLKEEEQLPMLNKAEYKKLLKMQEAGKELNNQQKAAIAAYEADYKIMNIVSEATHNYGCGMGGDASFLDASKAIHMSDEEGRPLFTTLNGDQLRQRMGEDGTLMVDDEGNPVYENLEGSDYEGFAEVFAQRGYPKADEEGNFLYTDADGNTVTQIKDEEGNVSYKNADGSEYEGSEEDLKQQLEPYNMSEEYKNIEDEVKNVIEDVEDGKYPLDRTSSDNNPEDKDKNKLEA